MVIHLSTKNGFTESTLCAAVLFWCKIHELLFHRSSLFFHFLSACSGPQVLLACLPLIYPLNNDDTLNTENNQWVWPSVLTCSVEIFLLLGDVGFFPVHELTLCFRVVLENLCFVRHDFFYQFRICWESLHDVKADVFPVLFLLTCEVFWYYFCTSFCHLQNLMQNFLLPLWKCSSCLPSSNTQISVFPHNLINFLNVFINS